MKYVSNPPVAGIIACSSPPESLVTKYSTFKFSVKDNTRCCIFGVVAEPGIAGRISQNFLDITATPVKTNFQNKRNSICSKAILTIWHFRHGNWTSFFKLCIFKGFFKWAYSPCTLNCLLHQGPHTRCYALHRTTFVSDFTQTDSLQKLVHCSCMNAKVA